jgi:hypothetical protein
LSKARKNHPDRYVGLTWFLLNAYAPDHPAILLTAPFRAGMPLLRHVTTVAQLPTCHEFIHTGMTLYLPAREERSVNRGFAHDLSTAVGVFSEE